MIPSGGEFIVDAIRIMVSYRIFSFGEGTLCTSTKCGIGGIPPPEFFFFFEIWPHY